MSHLHTFDGDESDEELGYNSHDDFDDPNSPGTRRRNRRVLQEFFASRRREAGLASRTRSRSHSHSEHGSSSDSDDDLPCGPLPYDEEHPNKYVPWGMKEYPDDIIEAWTKVHNYALSGSVANINDYLSKLSKEVLDQPNHEGESLLYMAAFRGLAQVVDDLLKAGATPNKGDCYFGGTPLMTATQNCHVEVVEKLLEYVDVNERNSDGFTAIFSAAECGIGHEKMEFLDCPHKEENMRLMRPRNKILLNMLIEKGADVNCSSNIGLTPLLLAVKDRNTAAVRILLDHGADPVLSWHHTFFGENSPRINALDSTAQIGNAELMSMILEKCGSRKELLSRDNAMRCAVKGGHLSCVRCLLDAGFDADLGVKLPSDELAEYRRSKDAYPILASIDTNACEVVPFLLTSGASSLYHGEPIRKPIDRCPLYVAFFLTGNTFDILLDGCAEIAKQGQYHGTRTPEFPVDDIRVWKQPLSRFKLLLQAGFVLNLDSVPLASIQNSNCYVFDEVHTMWTKLSPFYSMKRWLMDYEVQPPSLSDMCRNAIRRRIGFPRILKRSLSVELLPVPCHLQDYLWQL